ncbi:MAG: response regulator [Acidobacteriaceae bacterium]
MTAEILLVDDNAVQATTRKAILLRTGRSVLAASNATQALGILEDAALLKSLGLVITDHCMPGMNGPEFVAELRERLPQVPVVVLSGFPDVEGEYEGMNVVFHMKPVAPDQLIAIAESLLEPPMTRTA